MPSASEMIIQFLEEAGIQYVFGIPGGGTGQILPICALYAINCNISRKGVLT